MTPFATYGRWLGVAVLAVAVAAPALAQRNVTLRLNTATLPDTTLPSIFNSDAAAAGIQVRGCLDGCADNISDLPDGNSIAWDARTTLLPMNDGGDYWSTSFQIPDNETLNFKFYSDQAEMLGIGGWEDGGNHQIASGTGDVTLDLHYFEKGDDRPYDWRPFSADGDSVAVWFRVYMLTEDAVTRENNTGYDRDDMATVVGIRGDNALGGTQDGTTTIDWGATNVILNRESTDDTLPGYDLYSGLVKYPASASGMTQSYKYFFSDSDTPNGWEADPNRTFTVPAAGTDTTLQWVHFSDSPPFDPGIVQVTSNIAFTVNVQPLTSIGLFTTGEDAVQVRGGFNGWDCPTDNQDDCLLTQQPFSSNFSREFPLTSTPGSMQNYKYYVDFQPPFTDSDGETLDIGWEEPLDFGGGDRPFTFAGTATQQVGPEFFNNIRAGNVIPDGSSIDVTFSVDMTEATTFEVDPFIPGTDTVAVRFADNVWLLTQGFVPGSEDLVDVGDGNAIDGFQLTDPDGDLIYTGTLTVDGPSYNGIGYNYFYSNEARAGVVNEGRGGFGPGRRRYRYITDVTAAQFNFAQDAFKEPGANGDFTPWEINPTGPFAPGDLPNSIANGASDIFVANEEGPGRTEGIALSAPRPNPTRARAEFDLTIERASYVHVAVIDLMGRTVATLADGTFAAGQTTFGLSTSDLAAGVYVVRVQADGEVATRRLTVVR
ncbi:MAG: T9SS type A sorting domain-containing protein [Bacteroidota bacterium]